MPNPSTELRSSPRASFAVWTISFGWSLLLNALGAGVLAALSGTPLLATVVALPILSGAAFFGMATWATAKAARAGGWSRGALLGMLLGALSMLAPVLAGLSSLAG